MTTEKPSTACANAVIINVVSATPTVESTTPCFNTGAICFQRVLSPPEKQDEHQCDDTDELGDCRVVEVDPAGPSEPVSIPRARNSSSVGMPKRSDILPDQHAQQQQQSDADQYQFRKRKHGTSSSRLAPGFEGIISRRARPGQAKAVEGFGAPLRSGLVMLSTTGPIFDVTPAVRDMPTPGVPGAGRELGRLAQSGYNGARASESVANIPVRYSLSCLDAP